MFGARARVRQHLSPLSSLSRRCPRPPPLCPLSRAPPQNHLTSRSSSSFPAVSALLSETNPNHMLGLARPRIRAIFAGDVGLHSLRGLSWLNRSSLRALRDLTATSSWTCMLHDVVLFADRHGSAPISAAPSIR